MDTYDLACYYEASERARHVEVWEFARWLWYTQGWAFTHAVLRIVEVQVGGEVLDSVELHALLRGEGNEHLAG